MKHQFFKTLLLIPLLGSAQDDVIRFQPIRITASRISSSLAAETRDLDILTREEIDRIPVQTVQELLQFMDGVDMQQRGINSVQADLSLRGGGFEQVLVLVDGVRMNDPQTGHHNTDIPVPLSEVDRIEILKGHASSMYGPDGYAGVIHIITRDDNAEYTRIRISGGHFGTLQTGATHTHRFGRINTRLALEHHRSDGYRPVSDFNIGNASASATWRTGAHAVRLTAGSRFNKFGANDFYAAFPSREKTRALSGILNYRFRPHDYLQWNTCVHARQHRDHFVLDFTNPEWYINDHITESFGTESSLVFQLTRHIRMAAGGDFLYESLESTSMGDYAQERMGAFTEIVLQLPKQCVLNTGLRMDRHQTWGLHISPSVNIGIKTFKSFNWRAAFGHIFRAPSFTERYYNSPANIGDPTLQPESGWNAETGCDGRLRNVNVSMTAFRRSEKERIDWIAYQTGDPWRAVNLGTLTSTGTSFSVSGNTHGLLRWSCHYTWIHQKTPAKNVASKYQLRALRHHAGMQWHLAGPWKTNPSFFLEFKQRKGDPPIMLASFKCSRQFANSRLIIQGINLFGTHYEEILNVPMPGRYFMGGVEIGWPKVLFDK
ncbi:TonB-dependent receptor [bacterium]|nr:TonB-dependent receptor [bacterium]